MSAPRAQSRSSEQAVIDRLHEVTGHMPTWSGSQHMAVCPAHGDRTPSLAVRWKDGAVGLWCHAGCTQTGPEPVLDALNLQMGDLFDEPLRKFDDLDHVRRKKRSSTKTTKRATGPEPGAQWRSLPLDRQPDTVTKPATEQERGEVTHPWREVCWHLRTSPGSDEPTWAVIRLQQDYEHGYDKEFRAVHKAAGRTGGRYKSSDDRWHRLPDGWVTKRPAAEQQELYRAPTVRAAKAADSIGPVWLPEGESDADAIAMLGQLAVTEGGATVRWQNHDVDLLDGMDVVLVLDRDEEGIRRGERVARLLAGRARSVRIVQPIGDGNKDIRDHLADGYLLNDLREIDLAVPGTGPSAADGGQKQEAEADPADATVTDLLPPQAAPKNPAGPPNERPNEYLVRHGELVERVWKDGTPAYKTMLGCVAWVDAVTAEDNGTEETRYARSTRDVRFVLQRHDSGQVAEQRELRVDVEKITKGTWHQEWPWPDTIVARGRRNLDRTLDAIYTAVPSPPARQPVYTATGWRHTDTGWVFVHGAGAIGRGGSLPGLDVDIDGVLARTALPEPSADAAELRQAWLAGTEPLRQLPARIAAPLGGFVFRSIIGGAQQMVLHLHGPRGTLKTAATRLALQHVVPGLRYPQIKEMASGASGLSSPKGMQRLLGAAKDVPMEIDDLAPDRGGAAEAQTRLAELARQVYNASGQLKAGREAGRMVQELPPRCSLITTGEITAGGSAETRCFNILVEPGALSVDLIAELERPERCDARALLGASFVRWCAEHYDTITPWIEELTSILGAAWRRSLADLPHDDGVLGRLAEAATGCTVGTALETAFLTGIGAITDDEAQQTWDWAIAGIQEAARQLEADASDPAVKLVGWSQEALATKAAHLTGPNGGPPQVPGDEMAPARYGWTPQHKTAGIENTITWQPNGTMIGTVPAHRTERVYLVPDATIEAAKKVAARTETRWAESKVGFSSALQARGWIATSNEAGRIVRCPNREIDGASRRVWDLDRTTLDGHDPRGENAEPGGPRPLDPRLTTSLGLGELPLDPAPTGPVSIEPDRSTKAADRSETEPTTPVSDHDDHPKAQVTEQSAPGQHAPEANDQRAELTTSTTTSPTGHEPVADHFEPTLTGQLTGQQAPVVAADDSSGAASSALEETPMTRAPQRSKRERRVNNGSGWTYPAMVADPDAVYLPDGTALSIDEDHFQTLADVAEMADALGVGHQAAPGQIWLTKRATDRMGLRISDDDDLPDPDEEPKRFNQVVGELLTTRGGTLLASTRAAGWSIGNDDDEGDPQIRPRMRLHRTSDNRVLTVILAHYSTLWDPRQTGPDHHEHPLPEPDDDPAGYGLELARRAARLADLLGEPWASSAGAMGAAIVDRGRKRAKDPVAEAGEIPDLGDTGGQNALETTWSWWRRFRPGSLDELARTPYVHRFDGRASWLVCAGTMSLGYGEYSWHDADQAQRIADERRHSPPFGLWRITLPSWQHATLFPPHPAIPRTDPTEHGGDPVRCWVTTPTLRLLRSNEDGHLGLDIPVHEAWIWEKEGRKLASWYATVRDALKNARRHAAESTDPAEAATWSAVADVTKNIYAGYIGRMISPATKYNENRPWHHQPVWRAAIVAEARRRDYTKLNRHFAASGVAPVAAIGVDEFWFLSESADPASVAPEEDNGYLGKLRPKGAPLTITPELAEKICGTTGSAMPLHLALGEEEH